MLRHYRRQGVVGQVAEAGWSWLQPVASAISLLASAASEAEASEYPGEVVTITRDPVTLIRAHPGEAVRRVSDPNRRGPTESFMAAVGDPGAPPRLS